MSVPGRKLTLVVVLPAAVAQPWLLGLVFVVVALVSWNRLQHWRGRSGAGYQLPRHQHAV
jgi:hypothetical protein